MDKNSYLSLEASILQLIQTRPEFARVREPDSLLILFSLLAHRASVDFAQGNEEVAQEAREAIAPMITVLSILLK